MKYLPDEKARDFLTALAEEYEVYLPVVEEDVVNYRRDWDRERPFAGLRAGNTVLSPKDLFFPQTENIFRFSLGDDGFEIEPEDGEEKKRLIIGMRACDLRSLNLLDQVFLSDAYRDETYARRRENTAIITLSCTEPDQTCFCTAFDTDPGRPQGGALRLTELDGGFAVEVTGEDQAVVSFVEDLLCPLEKDRSREVENLQLKARDKVELAPAVAGIEGELSERFEAPLFEEFAARCLGCGICTYLCPTCHCYDLESAGQGPSGVRFRCWDSCMFSNFTRLAGGENPRPTRRERIRNRFLHKLQYFPERYDNYACTGCGRCLVHCPVNVDISEFIGSIREVKVDD